MASLWKVVKQVSPWGEAPCDCVEDEEPSVQESSGIVTLSVLYLATAALFICANTIANRFGDQREQQKRRQTTLTTTLQQRRRLGRHTECQTEQSLAIVEQQPSADLPQGVTLANMLRLVGQRQNKTQLRQQQQRRQQQLQQQQQQKQQLQQRRQQQQQQQLELQHHEVDSEGDGDIWSDALEPSQLNIGQRPRRPPPPTPQQRPHFMDGGACFKDVDGDADDDSDSDVASTSTSRARRRFPVPPLPHHQPSVIHQAMLPRLKLSQLA